MKTLKKTLCLVLAVVMVLGLGVMSASAKLDNYADENAITYREAVDVMSGIGVLQGDAGGFRPTDTVKRSEAAKIIAYLLVGNATQADALKTNSDPFTDVPATHWAAGYIAYCANAGIITGMGDGTFAPDAQVTGLQFAKMLLCALGYNANDEYSGADWSINVSKDALRLGVFDDNLAGATNTPSTREECALYAFNIAARERDGQLGLAKVSYSALLGGYITGSGNLGTDSSDANKARTIAGDYKLKKDDRDEDDFERDTGHYWYLDDARKTVITADYDENGHLKATYTTGVTGDDIYQLLGKDASASDTVLEFYLNGEARTETASAKKTEIAKDNFKKGNGETLDHTGNGVQTYVYSWYDNGDMHIKICIIDTYLAQVDDVTAGTSKKDPVTQVTILDGWDADNDSADPYTVSLDGKGFNTEEFEEDDYVLITVTYNGKIKSMEPVKTVENNISRYNKTGKKITVTSAGTDYVAAKNTATDADLYAADDEDNVNKGIVDGEKHTLYVDNYGYLIAVADVEVDSSYVYAAHFGYKNTTGEFDGSDIAVKLYYADGTSKVVTLNTKQSENNGAAGKGDSVFADVTDPDTLAGYEGLYKLTMKSGKAVLSSADNVSAPANTAVKKGISSIDSTRADSKTVFFYVKVDSDGNTYAWDSDDFAVNVYTGINSVPTNKDKHTDNNYADAVTIAADGTKAKAVLVDDSLDGDTTDTVYFFTGDYNVDESDWTVTYDTYVNGKSEPLEISYKDKETKDEKVAEFVDSYVNKFFTLNGKNEPIDTKLVDTDGTTPKAVNKAKYDDELTLSSGDVNDYDLTANGTVFSIDGMKIIDLTGNDDIISSAKALKKAADNGNTIEIAVQYADNSSNTISYLYLVQNDAP